MFFWLARVPSPMTPEPVAATITVVVLAVAPMFGIYALLALDRFRRHAFGGFARGASWMMGAVGAGLVYYAFVVALQWRNGSIEETWTNPWGLTAAMLMLQSAAAAVTLAAVALAARHFQAIAEP